MISSHLYKVILFWHMKLFHQYLINFKDNFYKILFRTTGVRFKRITLYIESLCILKYCSTSSTPVTPPILHTQNVKKQQQRFRYTCTILLWWVSLVCVYYIVYKINSTCSKSFIKVFAARTQYVIGWIATPPWSIPVTTVPLYKYIFFPSTVLLFSF